MSRRAEVGRGAAMLGPTKAPLDSVVPNLKWEPLALLGISLRPCRTPGVAEGQAENKMGVASSHAAL